MAGNWRPGRKRRWPRKIKSKTMEWTPRMGTHGPAGPARSVVTGKVYESGAKPDTSTDSWRVVGSECPWNTTPGIRQVWHNGRRFA